MACYASLPAGYSHAEGYAAELLGFLARHRELAELLLQNNLEFYSRRLWAELPPGWGAALSSLPATELVCLPCPDAAIPAVGAVSWPPSLLEFVGLAKRLPLPRYRAAASGEPATDIASGASSGAGSSGGAAAGAAAPVLPPSECPFAPSEVEMAGCGVEVAPAHSAARQLLRHIKPKKRHELQRLAQLVAAVAAAATGAGARPTVVDIGCGQGYLARMLACAHGLSVVGVEAAAELAQLAEAKRDRLGCELQKKQAAAASASVSDATAGDGDTIGAAAGGGSLVARNLQGAPPPRFVARAVTTPADITTIMHEITTSAPTLELGLEAEPAPESRSPVAGAGCLLVGLHACGALTPMLLDAFSTTAAGCVR
jgi:precorrin-6B methylase 2